ncbi:MAG: hypothetical protein IPL46_27280 [Saprospiraceae bacterium]|nr:hypothetical protein [Saprospiraceae bacterium]
MKTLSHIVLALYLLVIACKEVDEFIPVQEAIPFDFSKEFTNATDTLSYHLNLIEPIIIRTPRGTEFVFKPNMFTFTNGDYCSCEKVTIELIELDKKRDYLVHQASTISNGKVLISAGAYHIAAFYQGKPLQLSPDHLACFWSPADKLDPAMQLFFGYRNGTEFNWEPAERTSTVSSITPGQWQYNDTTSFIVGYQCFSDRLAWINVDKYVSDAPKNSVCIKLDPRYTVTNTVLFAILKKEQSILSLNYLGGNGFCLASIPVGTEVIFVAIHKQADDIYELAAETVSITENHFQSLSFNTKSFTDIKAF